MQFLNSLQHNDGRNLTVRCSLHRIVLRVYRDLAEPILLFVRFPVSSLLHTGRQLCTNIDCHDLLPAVRRGN